MDAEIIQSEYLLSSVDEPDSADENDSDGTAPGDDYPVSSDADSALGSITAIQLSTNDTSYARAYYGKQI
eukprot:IDg20389t1